ncbi:MAG: hypothetical protein HY318_10730, partial [Armatimonadetes bacterium]|nr:hypothetical protein [Armatimonadota bacterium]
MSIIKRIIHARLRNTQGEKVIARNGVVARNEAKQSPSGNAINLGDCFDSSLWSESRNDVM